jgi:trans-aconitate methyltransferase
VGTSEIREAYGKVADLYISMFGAVEQVDKDDLELIRRHLGTRTGPVLDLGCGPGHLTGYLHDLGVDIVGIDPVPEFISHANFTRPDIEFSLGTLQDLERPVHGWSGILAWYSLIHLPPSEIDGSLADLRSVIDDGGTLVTGVFTGDQVAAFEHKVLTAYRWPIDEFVQRVTRAGFVEFDRLERPADGPVRPHAAIAARAV